MDCQNVKPLTTPYCFTKDKNKMFCLFEKEKAASYNRPRLYANMSHFFFPFVSLFVMTYKNVIDRYVYCIFLKHIVLNSAYMQNLQFAMKNKIVVAAPVLAVFQIPELLNKTAKNMNPTTNIELEQIMDESTRTEENIYADFF